MVTIYTSLVLSVFALCFWIWKKSHIPLNRVSLPSLFFWTGMVFGYLGLPLVYVGFIRESSWKEIYFNEVVLWKMLLILSMFWISLSVGVNFASRSAFEGNFRIAGEEKDQLVRQKILWSLLFLLCFCVFYVYTTKIDRIASLALFDQYIDLETKVNRLAEFRSRMTNEFPGSYWRYKVFFVDILSYLSLVAFGWTLMKKESLSILMCVTSFLFAVFALTASLEKSLIVQFLFLLILMFYFIQYSRKLWHIGKKLYLSFFAMCTLLGVFMYNAISPPSIKSFVSSLIQRIFVGELVPFYFYVKLVPSYVEHLWGRGLPNPKLVFPFLPYLYTIELNKIARGLTKSSAVGSLPTGFYGELWVNFGFVGIVFGAFFFGYALRKISDFFASRNTSIADLGFFIYLTMVLLEMNITGFTRLLNVDIFIVIVVYFSFVAVAKLRKKQLL